MPDTPLRLYGPLPTPLVGAPGASYVLYTTPTLSRTTTFVRDITFANVTTTNIQVRMSIGAIADSSLRVFDFTVPAGDSYSFRGLWTLNPGDTLQAQQVTVAASPTWTAAVATGSTNGTGQTSQATGSWTPAANTLYLLSVGLGKAAGGVPGSVSSITGNGTWTLVATSTATTHATQENVKCGLYYWTSTAAGSPGTTTVNFTSSDHPIVNIDSVVGVFGDNAQSAPSGYSSTPILQSGTNNTTTGTSTGLTVTLASAASGGVMYVAACGERSGGGETSTAPAGYTELTDATASAGSQIPALTTYRITSPPGVSPIPANTWVATSVCGYVGAEMVGAQAVNVMVNGVEVSS